MGRRRELLSTAFENVGGQWIWYANAWSRGVIVSRDEREIYLAFKPVAFRRAIAGREPNMPRRRYWRTLGRGLLATIVGRDPKGDPS
jgi:hypothetical protein